MSGNGKTVSVYNRTRERYLAIEAEVADRYFRRLVGLAGKPRRWSRPGRGLWIVPSRGVHTIGMMFRLDLIFLDRNRNVIHLEESVPPFFVSAIELRAMSVLELPAHTISQTGTQLGDALEIFPAIAH